MNRFKLGNEVVRLSEQEFAKFQYVPYSVGNLPDDVGFRANLPKSGGFSSGLR